LTQAESMDQIQRDGGDAGGRRADNSVAKTLIWIGVAGLSAALAFTVVRAMISRQPVDPTSQRIQTLIDEANSLLKTLDDQKHTG
jgi:hypothetical protein